MDPEATSTAACRGGLVAFFFRCRLPSICRGMREVGATSRRTRRQGPAPGHGRNVPRARRQERSQAPGPTRRLTASARPTVFFHLHRTSEGAAGFSGCRRSNVVTLSIAIPESRRCRERALECRTVAGRLRVQNARDQMLRVAADYERMARDAEQREIAQGLSYLKALIVRQRRGRQAA